MIAPGAELKIYIATRPIDFRCGHDGLAAKVQEMLGLDPFNGSAFVFRSKRADRIKILVWDRTGLVLVHKRLEGCKFVWPAIADGVMRLSPAMFAADGTALSVAVEAIELGFDRVLAASERVFLYMPLMHSEELAVQERCVALFEQLRDATAGGPAAAHGANSLRYAVAHRDIVARFGRFPHRNAVLGRPSTAEELGFLAQPGSGF